MGSLPSAVNVTLKESLFKSRDKGSAVSAHVISSPSEGFRAENLRWAISSLVRCQTSVLCDKALTYSAD